MGRTILCPHCNSALNEDILKQRNSENICLVCGKPLDNSASADEHADWITWYYYGVKDSTGGYLTDKPIDLERPNEKSYLIKEFQAPPRDANGKSDAAKQELRKYVPDAFATPAPSSQTRCPRCHSTEIQLVPRKFSLLTGFATNKFDRMCVRCQKKF